MTDPLLGHVVDGRYEVRSRIASGGMATVYLAVDRRLDREIALKVLHQHLADTQNGDFVARFRREARTVAKLVHPGLVQVFDQGVDGRTTYLAMEYVDGTNLRQMLVDRQALPLGEALDLVEQVLEALATAHHAGLVHRDVKPENVLIATDGRVKLADFGLARAVTEMTTGASVVMGTAAYLAPELISVGTADARTDVYAVGVLLYEVLTGCQPFSGTSPVQIAFQHVHHEIPAPSDLVSWMPAEVDDLVRALAARAPADRPVDAAAALAMIKHLRVNLDLGTLARNAGTVGRTNAPEVPAPGPATAVFSPDSGRDPTVALPLGLGLGPTPGPGPEVGPDHLLSYAQPPAVAPPGSLEEDRRRRALVWLVSGVVALLVLGGGGTVWWFGQGPGARTTVPMVVGLDQADAEAALRKANLEPQVTEAFHPTMPPGKVISSDPERGTRLDRRAKVSLMVSKGPDWIQVPDGLVGKDLADAVAALTAAGLVSADPPLEDYSDTVPAGEVLSATLPDGSDATGGTQAMRGDTVTLTVSKGPAPVIVPELVDRTVSEVETLLDDAALQLDISEVWSDRPTGEILSQTPEAGTSLHRGDTIAVTVSKGPELYPVPDVTLMMVDQARQRLVDAGFEVSVDGRQRGLVLGQDPSGGSLRAKGTVVTLYTNRVAP
ncbi:MAG: Stk1 family PASTA domain-containing Ser/Thr kinase [Micrococcales bacterium]|nr:Stk1 family PASTA domain-containing Ser/Thr kinase [Micrococcales bacterium]